MLARLLFRTQVSSGSSIQDNVALIVTIISSALKQNQRREASGRIIRSILLKDARQNQAPSASQQEKHRVDKDKKPPRPPSVQLFQRETNGANEDRVLGADLHVVHTEKQEKRTRIRDRPDRGVWTPLRRSDSLHASDESLSSSASQSSEVPDFVEGLFSSISHVQFVLTFPPDGRSWLKEDFSAFYSLISHLYQDR